MSSDKVLEMLKEVFGEDIVIKDIPKELPKVKERPDGYESIIHPEVFEAVVHLTNAMDNLVHLYAKHRPDDGVKDDYAMIQYMFFDDMMDDAMSAISSMYGIHHISKDDIDGQAEEQNTSVPRMALRIAKSRLNEKLGELFELMEK